LGLLPPERVQPALFGVAFAAALGFGLAVLAGGLAYPFARRIGRAA
jgi:hypothetical protein